MNSGKPKVKISRRLGMALTLKAARVMQRRPNRPGQHGNTRPRKASVYKEQLMESSAFVFQYNISERQMQNCFERASSSIEPTGEALIRLLETRLDALVYRPGFAPTIYAARQFVSHGHIRVNGRRVDIPSYHLKVGDTISLKPNSSLLADVQQNITQTTLPDYIQVANGACREPD
jgi:small subunit ribosomal protein S4